MSQLQFPRDFPALNRPPRCFLPRETEEWEDSAQRWLSALRGSTETLFPDIHCVGEARRKQSDRPGQKWHGRGKATDE